VKVYRGQRMGVGHLIVEVGRAIPERTGKKRSVFTKSPCTFQPGKGEGTEKNSGDTGSKGQRKPQPARLKL